MDGQLWSWLLSIVGLAGFFLAGRKVWWAWYVNIFNQILWLTYSLVTEQYGFLVATFAYTAVFTKNAIAWTREHREKKYNDHYNVVCTICGKNIASKQSSPEFLKVILHAHNMTHHSDLGRPCEGKNSNICVAEGCFGNDCLKLKTKEK